MLFQLDGDAIELTSVVVRIPNGVTAELVDVCGRVYLIDVDVRARHADPPIFRASLRRTVCHSPT